MKQHSVLRIIPQQLRPRTRVERDRQQAARRDEWTAAAEAVLARAKDPTLHSVLELHRPTFDPSSPWPICLGCDSLDVDAEPPEWPCRTWALIRDQMRP